MSRFSSLINERCHDGVNYIPLGKVCIFQRGTSITSDKAEEGNIPVISGGQTPAFYHSKANRPSNTITVAGSGAYAGYVSFWKQPVFVADAFSVNPQESLDTKYTFYFLKSIQKLIFSKKKGAGVPHVHGKDLEKIEIPVPPIEVQQEIVRILDSFTGLIDNLNKELEDRKKQFEYYLNSLLELPGVPRKSLGDIGTLTRGKGLQKSDFLDEGVPCIHYGQLYTYYKTATDRTIKFVSEEVAKKSTIIHPNDVVITLTSENVEDLCTPLAWLGQEEVAVSGHTVNLHSNENPKFIVYCLKTFAFAAQKRRIAHNAKVVEARPDDLAKLTIPIPSKDKQQEIVKQLDCFDKLINKVIPSEISLRQKQYEYYLDQLLNFKRRES